MAAELTVIFPKIRLKYTTFDEAKYQVINKELGYFMIDKDLTDVFCHILIANWEKWLFNFF